MAVTDLVDRTYQPLRSSKAHQPGLILPKDKAVIEGLYGPTGDVLHVDGGGSTVLPVQNTEGGELYLPDHSHASGWSVDNDGTNNFRIFRGGSVHLLITPTGDVQITSRSAGYVLNPARVRMSRVTNQSAPHASFTSLAFDTPQYATSGWNSAIPIWTGALPTRLTAPVSGYYAIGGYVLWASGAGFTRIARLFLNSTTQIGYTQITPSGGGNGAAATATTEYYLNVNDYVEVQGYQDTGGVLNITGAGWMHFIAQ